MIRNFHNTYESLKVARLLMVLSSLSPLFILWAVRGNCLIPDVYFVTACLLFASLPTYFLWLRIKKARKNRDKHQFTAGLVEDQRSHILIYLFAILLPFYREEIANFRDLSAMIVALMFIAFLFWHLNLYYMNIFFALARYQVFTVSPPQDNNPHTGRERYALITYRQIVSPGDQFVAFRLSNGVYLEMRE